MDSLLEGQTLSYPGWQDDKAEAENLYQKHHASSEAIARQKLQGMKNKQRLFEGDRSHPDIVMLDQTIFTYPDWQADKKEAEDIHTAETKLRGLPVLGTIEVKIAAMKKKQIMHSNRSSVAFLRELDACTFTYDGWREDKEEAEKFYHTSTHCASGKLQGMKHKQQLFDGDRSHPDIMALDSATFTYPGWEKDQQDAENIHTATSVLRHVPLCGTTKDKLSEMERKETMHSGDRSSVPFLRELDGQTFTYDGWREDKEEAEKFYQKNHSFFAKLQGMKNKQRLFDGDRSHPDIVALDNTICTYPGWEDDKQEAERIHTTTTILRNMPTFGTVIDKLREISCKQTSYSNRSSVSFLRDLDSVSSVPRPSQSQPRRQHQQRASPARRPRPPTPPAAAATTVGSNRRQAKRSKVNEKSASSTTATQSEDTTTTQQQEDSEQEEEKNAEFCVVCLEEAPTHAYIPCGHRCVCSECAPQGANGSGGGELKCPVCRDTAMCISKIFL